MGMPSTRERILNILNDEDLNFKEYLKDNDIDSCIEVLMVDNDIKEFVGILFENGIDCRKYVHNLCGPIVDYFSASNILDYSQFKNITTIYSDTFNGNLGVNSIILPDSIQKIYNWAIINIDHLKDGIYLSTKSLTLFHPYAFNNLGNVPIIIDGQRFDNPDFIENYADVLKYIQSKGISTG